MAKVLSRRETSIASTTVVVEAMEFDSYVSHNVFKCYHPFECIKKAKHHLLIRINSCKKINKQIIKKFVILF